MGRGRTVRLSFPQGEHQDVIVPPGEITIGSAPDNTVVLATDGIQPHHASIVVDQRGFTLLVKGAEAWTHVNARPVREKAILRLGDVVSLQSVNLLLKPDSDDSIYLPAEAVGEDMKDVEANDTRYRQVPPKAVLRGVSGPYFGKVVAIRGRLVIGRGDDCDLVLDEPEMSRKHAMIEVRQNDIYLRDLGSTNGTYVNGVKVRDAALFTGDQLAFDRNRFLIEAPGMPLRRADARPAPAPVAADGRGQAQVTQTMRAIRLEQPTPTATPSVAPAAPDEPSGNWSPWWLIGAAALIALGIALLFLGLN
jgi:pSer/pThr/pTyr-binding forkhead associated (FHA) protein